MFNRAAFLSAFDVTPDSIADMADRANVEVPARETIRKWFIRASIPGEWWPVLIALVELDKGRPISLLPYVETGRLIDVFE
jgi:hypothetical protein